MVEEKRIQFSPLVTMFLKSSERDSYVEERILTKANGIIYSRTDRNDVIQELGRFQRWEGSTFVYSRSLFQDFNTRNFLDVLSSRLLSRGGYLGDVGFLRFNEDITQLLFRLTVDGIPSFPSSGLLELEEDDD